MHRTSRILALTTLLLPQAPPCSSPRRRLFRTRWPIRCFCWLWRFSASGGKRCFRSGLHSSCLPWAMRRVRRVCSFRRCCFSRWPTVPISAISSAPGDFLPVLPHGCFPRRCSRCSSPGSCPGSWIRPNGSASPFTVRSSPGCFTACSGIAGVCRMVPLRGPAVRFFRRRDSLEPFHRGRSRAHLRRDGSLLPGAVPVLLLCRKIASRPPV